MLGLLTGDRIVLARLLLGLVSWVALAFGVKRVCDGEAMPRLGLLAVAVLAIYPPLHFISSFLMTETLLVPLAVWLVAVGQMVSRSPGIRTGATLGLLYGITHLLKFNLLPFQFLHLAAILWRVPRRSALVTAFTCATVSIAALVPWAVRNYQCYGVICVETKSGFNLWLMNNPRHTEPFWNEEFRTGPELPDFTGLNEYERSAACRARFVAYVRDNPGRVAELCAARFLNTWPTAPVYLSLPKAVLLPIRVGNTVFYGLLLAGIVMAIRRRVLIAPVLLILYAAVACALTNGAIRHRIYAEPIMVIVAVYPIARLLKLDREVAVDVKDETDQLRANPISTRPIGPKSAVG